MTATLITDEEAIGHLRIDLVTDGNSPSTIIDEDYPTLVMKMEQAEDIILDYLKTHLGSGGESWDATTVPPRVKAAILLMLSALWDDREGQGDAGDYLRDDGPIANLLRRQRDPALA